MNAEKKNIAVHPGALFMRPGICRPRPVKIRASLMKAPRSLKEQARWNTRLRFESNLVTALEKTVGALEVLGKISESQTRTIKTLTDELAKEAPSEVHRN